MILGESGPAVVISAETAAYLERFCKVAALRQRLRDGLHQQVSQELLDLRRVAMAFDPARLPQRAAVGSDSAEVAPGLRRSEFSAAEAADLLNIGERAVRLACEQDRLDGRKVGGRWRITAEAIKHFKTTKTA